MVQRQGVAIEDEDVVSSSQASDTGTVNDRGSIIGGAVGVAAVSIIPFTAGSGFGIPLVEPASFANEAPHAFAIVTGAWLIVMQWLSAGFGGYLAGRLRTAQIRLIKDEILFRDTTHGFLASALATIVLAALFAVGTGFTGTTTELVNAGSADSPAAAVSEEALEAAANFSIFTAISLLVGGFIGAVAGGLGGYHRDAVYVAACSQRMMAPSPANGVFSGLLGLERPRKHKGPTIDDASAC